jgi:hypothetical protein
MKSLTSCNRMLKYNPIITQVNEDTEHDAREVTHISTGLFAVPLDFAESNLSRFRSYTLLMGTQSPPGPYTG